jgi:hypothetical protein
MSDNRWQTPEPWARMQHPRSGGPAIGPMIALVYGALAIGILPDGRLILTTLHARLMRRSAKYEKSISTPYALRHGGARIHGCSKRGI